MSGVTTTSKNNSNDYDAPPPYAPPTAPVQDSYQQGYQQQGSNVQFVQVHQPQTRTVYLDQDGNPIQQQPQTVPPQRSVVYVDRYGRELQPVGVDDQGRVHYGTLQEERRGRRSGYSRSRSRSTSPLLDRKGKKKRRRRHSSSSSDRSRKKDSSSTGFFAGLGACCAAMLACSCLSSLFGGFGFGLPFFGGPGHGHGHGHGGGGGFGGGFGGGGPGGP